MRPSAAAGVRGAPSKSEDMFAWVCVGGAGTALARRSFGRVRMGMRRAVLVEKSVAAIPVLRARLQSTWCASDAQSPCLPAALERSQGWLVVRVRFEPGQRERRALRDAETSHCRKASLWFHQIETLLVGEPECRR